MSQPHRQISIQFSLPQVLIAALTVVKWLWRGFLAVFCLIAIIFGFDGNFSAFWVVAVFGLPTLWLERKWPIRAKAIASIIFAGLFVSFGVYCMTPRGRASFAAEIKRNAVQAQQDAIAQHVADKQAAKEQARQKMEDAKQAVQQEAQQKADDAAQQAQQAAQQEQEEVVAQNSDSAKIDAYLTAQDFVSERLKSPGSAKYPDYEADLVKRIGDNTYQVSAYVDSQNGFGALLRTQWTLVVHKGTGDNWDCKDVVIDQD